jgi:hypothetical protein
MGRIFALLLGLAILVGVPVLGYRHAKLNSIRSITITVNNLPDRSQQYNANGDKNTYANLVYTDKGTFSNVDSYFPLKQDSSDLYGKLHEGGTYRCEVAGWRIGLFSQYPDLIRCEAAD